MLGNLLLGGHMKKSFFILLLLCFTMVLISGCVDYSQTYDDDEKIASYSDGYSSMMSSTRTWGKDFSMSATFTGTKTIWRYRASEDVKIRLSYMLSVTEGGKAKLVLITPENELIILSENTDNSVMSEMKSETITLKKGNNRIKIVGQDSPKFQLKLNTDGFGQLGEED